MEKFHLSHIGIYVFNEEKNFLLLKNLR